MKESWEMLLENFQKPNTQSNQKKSSFGKCSPLKYRVVHSCTAYVCCCSTKGKYIEKVIRRKMSRVHEMNVVFSELISIFLNALGNQLFSIKRNISRRQKYTQRTNWNYQLTQNMTRSHSHPFDLTLALQLHNLN